MLLILINYVVNCNLVFSRILSYGRMRLNLLVMMGNPCIVVIMGLLFSCSLSTRTLLLLLLLSCFAKEVFLEGSTSGCNRLIQCHLFGFVRILCGYQSMHNEQSQLTPSLLYKEYVLLALNKQILYLQMYFLLSPISIK